MLARLPSQPAAVLFEMTFELALSSRGDLDGLHQRPSSRRDRLAALASLCKHELDRITNHRSCLIEPLALRVHLGELRHVGIYPAVASILVHHVESQRAHTR